MNNVKIIIFLAISQIFISHSMSKRPAGNLYPPYQEENTDQQSQAKKRIWQVPALLNHGVYLASVENYSGKALRVAHAPLHPVKEPNESYSFVTHEDQATFIDEVSENPGIQFSKILHFKPTAASNNESSAEGVCIVIETTQQPSVKKFLWILRQLDYQENHCNVQAYFDDNPNKKFFETKKFKNSLNAKIVTRVNLYIDNPDLHNIDIKTATFGCDS